ncbi:hypothetical protein [Maritimibacter sp. HL-12]|uniref:hypothetical protein n=1 Tax=Maritimibacter sp. HL-12 TaxID=1162418 RepID=UPI000A0F2B3F|nr:hypothetical protein [Maritimibacter sp. HL-12]SMH50825.1 hypothetical protein SAMN05661107_2379 [Maritimibacter sp. HL-12]
MRLLAYAIGGALVALGGIAFLGAVELLRDGAGAEDLAQGFLVPVTLVVIGGFVIWMGLKGRNE